MRKGLLIGAITGFITGLIIQSTGTLTGMATQGLSPEATHFLATSFVITLFIASLFGIIGAFLGALMQDVLEHK